MTEETQLLSRYEWLTGILVLALALSWSFLTYFLYDRLKSNATALARKAVDEFMSRAETQLEERLAEWGRRVDDVDHRAVTLVKALEQRR